MDLGQVGESRSATSSWRKYFLFWFGRIISKIADLVSLFDRHCNSRSFLELRPGSLESRDHSVL